MLEVTMTCEDEADLQELIAEIEHQAVARAWTAEQKIACGVVVSMDGGELCVQRGIQRKAQDGSEAGTNTAGCGIVTLCESDVAEGISVPLLKKYRQSALWLSKPRCFSSRRRRWR